MSRTAQLLAAVCLLALPGCALERLAGERTPEGARPPDAPEGYRAVIHRTPWALDRVSKDGTVIWIRTAESGCNRFHHASVTEASGGLRIAAFDVLYIPKDENHGCRLYLFRPRHRVELPRPLGGDRILGECVPGDPRETCALLHDVVGARS